MVALKTVTALAPLAIEPRNFKVGDTVRKFYNGRDLSPYVGTVIRLDAVCNKVDVQWPMGAAREAPEELIRENVSYNPPYDYTMSSEQKMAARVANAHLLKRGELEDAARTLLMAGYDETETINLLMDGYGGAVTARYAKSVIDLVKADVVNKIALAHSESLSA